MPEILRSATPGTLIIVDASDLRSAFSSWCAELDRTREEEKRRESEDKMIPATDVMRRLGITRPTLVRWDERGYLSSHRVGSRLFYRLSDVEALEGSRPLRPACGERKSESAAR